MRFVMERRNASFCGLYLLPNFLFDFIFGKIFGVYSVMDHFTGRRK